MLQPFEGVRDQLLRAGIAPRHVRRYIVELQEHLADLTARERSGGLDARAAGERARAVLGTDSQLVQAMTDRTPRSMTARAPWAMVALLPVVLLIAGVATIALSMAHLLGPVHASWPGGVPDSYTGTISAASFVADYLLGPVIAAACIAVALRQRLTSGWVWAGLGLVALFSGMFGFYMNIMPPRGDFPAGAAFSAFPNVIVDGHWSGTGTLALIALRAAILFAIAGVAFQILRTRPHST